MLTVDRICVSDDITVLNKESRPLRASEGRSAEESILCCVCVCVGG